MTQRAGSATETVSPITTGREIPSFTEWYPDTRRIRSIRSPAPPASARETTRSDFHCAEIASATRGGMPAAEIDERLRSPRRIARRGNRTTAAPASPPEGRGRYIVPRSTHFSPIARKRSDRSPRYGDRAGGMTASSAGFAFPVSTTDAAGETGLGASSSASGFPAARASWPGPGGDVARQRRRRRNFRGGRGLRRGRDGRDPGLRRHDLLRLRALRRHGRLHRRSGSGDSGATAAFSGSAAAIAFSGSVGGFASAKYPSVGRRSVFPATIRFTSVTDGLISRIASRYFFRCRRGTPREERIFERESPRFTV